MKIVLAADGQVRSSAPARQSASAARRMSGRKWLPASRILAIACVGDEGGSLVEFALTLPMMMVLITGMFSFGIILNQYLVLTHAVDTGARLLAVSAQQTTDPCSTASTQILSSAPTLSSKGLSYSYVIGGSPYSGTTCNGVPATGSGSLASGTTVSVTATYPCQLNVFALWNKKCTLTASTTELVQ
jgi:Flp pilus assembly protein TadG